MLQWSICLAACPTILGFESIVHLQGQLKRQTHLYSEALQKMKEVLGLLCPSRDSVNFFFDNVFLVWLFVLLLILLALLSDRNNFKIKF